MKHFDLVQLHPSGKNKKSVFEFSRVSGLINEERRRSRERENRKFPL